MVDRASMQKIILNLLSNSIKFTPIGGKVTYESSLKDAEAGKINCWIKVSDTGKGISDEFRERIFEPFAQENPLTDSASGSGMGLSIVKSIVDSMHGSIDVKSDKENGTTFIVDVILDEPQGHGSGPSCSDSCDKQDICSGRRVLLCEDNMMNQEIAKTMLSQRHMEVETAADGQMAVEMFTFSAEWHYDVILMDIRMPIMDGYGATSKIRKLERRDAKTIPIIAMTADAFAADIKKCIDAGMNGHIAKPIDQDKMFKTIAGFLVGADKKQQTNDSL